jgi:nucleotide-binding universal stress UspA family protein
MSPIRRALIAIDGSAESNAASSCLSELRFDPSVAFRLVAVIPDPVHSLPGPFTGGEYVYSEVDEEVRRREEQFYRSALEAAAGRLQLPGREVTTALPRGDAAREILAAAGGFGADLVVMGSRGLTGLDRFILGSVAWKVARQSKCSVLVARTPKHELKHAVLAVDGSSEARHATHCAATLPLPGGTDFTVAHVLRPYMSWGAALATHAPEPGGLVSEIRRRQDEVARTLTENACSVLREGGKPASAEVRYGDPAAEILALTGEKDADLLVFGARGVSMLEGLVVGSVADRLLSEARCSLLVVR